MNTKTRRNIAQSIIGASLAGAIFCIWQIVRTFQGEISAPDVVFWIGKILQIGYSPPSERDWIEVGINYAGALAAWSAFGTLILAVGLAAARIAEVGYAQFRIEEAAASAERKRMEQVRADRERRYSQRRKQCKCHNNC